MSERESKPPKVESEREPTPAATESETQSGRESPAPAALETETDERASEQTSTEGSELDYPPLDLESPQLTLRAVLSGCVLGGVLSLSNIYAGLKIGWGFNMSITAMLLGYAVFKLTSRRPFGLLENNINQTAASAAASISSAGLVAPIPAFTILTGEKLSYPVLALWTAAVSLVGVVVAIGLRRQMIMVDKLPFPGGVASAETIKQIYAHGREAMARVKVLLAGAAIGAATKLTVHFAKLHAWAPPAAIGAKAGGPAGVAKYTLANLGLALDPSVLLFGVGGIIGLRAGVSIFIGALVAWGYLAPMALDAGWASPGKADPNVPWFGAVNKWMLWPGVGMMVAASLTSFFFSWRSIVAALKGGGGKAQGEGAEDVPRKVLVAGVAIVLVLATIPQVAFFGVPLWLAAGAVLFTFLLAIVAGRVSGETGITPVGPMGKVTQLVFGVLSPGNVAGNLMAANVTGGAASQCGDLLHDLKCGALIGASPRQQAVGQTCGVLAGALVGSAGYLVLVPDPKKMLLTSEWPAPAVAAWKAVAELFKVGFAAMPPKALEALAIAVALGILIAALEKAAPAKIRPWVPSANSLGLAAVIPAYNSISMFLGAVVAAIAAKLWPSWSRRFLIVLAAGLIAGESLVGVALALWQTVSGLAGG